MKTQNTTEKRMKSINVLIWNKLQNYLNTNRLQLTKVEVSAYGNINYSAWILKLNSKDTVLLDKVLKVLDEHNNGAFSVYKHNDKKLYISPTVTQEEKVNFLELKTVIQGEEVLKAQKEVLKQKEKWASGLRELRDLKRELGLIA